MTSKITPEPEPSLPNMKRLPAIVRSLVLNECNPCKEDR